MTSPGADRPSRPVAAPEFFGYRGTASCTRIRLGHLEISSYTVRTNSSAHSTQYTLSLSPIPASQLHQQWGRQRQHLCSCSAMTQHYPTTSTAAAVWASGPSYPVSANLLIYTHTHTHTHAHTAHTHTRLPAEPLSTTLLFVSACCMRDKESCGSSTLLSLKCYR